MTKLFKEDNPNSYNLTRINNPILKCSIHLTRLSQDLWEVRFGPRVKWAIKGDNER